MLKFHCLWIYMFNFSCCIATIHFTVSHSVVELTVLLNTYCSVMAQHHYQGGREPTEVSLYNYMLASM